MCLVSSDHRNTRMHGFYDRSHLAGAGPAGMKPTHTIVNCWFCNQDTVVPYGNRNCWDCPHCEQYNGFQENGDYNKPIPAQYLEHLNHVVSSAPRPRAPAQPQQWVSSQVLLCRRCSHHQTTKIKQLAAFAPRDEGRYDEEIEVYRHHLEQMYKLCRPCQAAVEYYIKHQNRQLRALLLSHQFRRRDADQTHTQVQVEAEGQRLYLLPGSPLMLRLQVPLLGFSPEARRGLVWGVEEAHDMRSAPEGGSARSSRSIKKEDDSSQSSTCVVDTTTQGCTEEAAAWRGRFRPSLVRGLLAVSLAANVLFTSAYLYQVLR
ncbi:transmembrane protein 201-like [Leptonychotes weddellii]|uniref:Transmembrane protein 201-like n=1 Tax=Leptonychotes weddellii TaxID=9713 RepID=A0A7F8Q4M3_LEPWE|nr:transmembrane protein 201-like [Leptonychotes weddellii]